MKQYTIPSSKGGDGYVVTLDGVDGNECGCKAFEYSTAEPRTCKHIKTAQAMLKDEFDKLVREHQQAAADDADREMGIDTSYKD